MLGPGQVYVETIKYVFASYCTILYHLVHKFELVLWNCIIEMICVSSVQSLVSYDGQIVKSINQR